MHWPNLLSTEVSILVTTTINRKVQVLKKVYFYLYFVLTGSSALPQCMLWIFFFFKENSCVVQSSVYLWFPLPRDFYLQKKWHMIVSLRYQISELIPDKLLLAFNHYRVTSMAIWYVLSVTCESNSPACFTPSLPALEAATLKNIFMFYFWADHFKLEMSLLQRVEEAIS